VNCITPVTSRGCRQVIREEVDRRYSVLERSCPNLSDGAGELVETLTPDGLSLDSVPARPLGCALEKGKRCSHGLYP
jgi:hypothetical protein